VKRAFAILQVKSVDAEQRIVTGLATSASTDLYGDVVEPDGAEFTLPIPLLWQHNSREPIGEVFAAKVTSEGIEIKARLAQTDVPGKLKDRLDEAWQSITLKLVRGLSIGFQSIEESYDKVTGGFHYLKWLWLELSAVTIPANTDASIQTIRSLDQATAGRTRVVSMRTRGSMTRKDRTSMLAACRACQTALAACRAACQGLMSDATMAAACAACDAACAACETACAACLSASDAQMMVACAACAAACSACADVCDACAAACGATPKYAACAAACSACSAACEACESECTAMAVMPPVKAASGRQKTPSGASDSSRTVKLRTDTSMAKKSFADQIAGWEATRAAKAARLDELLTKSGDAGVTLDEAEAEEHDTITDEIEKIDAQLVRLRAAETREKAAAVPVAGRTPAEGAQARTGVITVTKKLPPGIQFARYAMCVAASKGSRLEAMDLAKRHYPDDDAILGMIEKAAVGAANTQTAGNASELVYATVADDFIEYLRPKTILGKFGTNGIPNLRRVPFNVRVSGFSTGTTGYWVGEGLPVPMSKATSMTMSLTWAKIEALAVLTKEEVRFSNPSAESKVRDDLAAAIIARMDIDFIDPGKAAVANVSPASITFNTTPIAPSGATAAAMRTDLATLLGTFTTLLLDPSDIVLVMSAGRALQLSLMINTLGNQSFPGMALAGGTLLGIPVITSQAMVALGSPDEDIIVAVKAGDVYLADDGNVTVEASDQASIEMLDASLQQNGITGTGASLVSLWQAGLLGLKANREVTWKLRRAGAARYIGPAAYVA
jgi:HK97 family phage major capsid protein/HK97 family phage prohead protease